ncbi:MAG: catalase [Oscillospiraceae bacterium]|nr:catalase [Oscillospiraceae bacterium]
MKAWQHFKTITRHRWLVCQGCFRVGLYWQGLVHDLSKYSPTEFLSGVRYYQGTRSPNTAEREEKGYSEAWIHHKGRNPHHYEYWTDLSLQTRCYEPVPVPRKYLVEMVMDRRAACMVYQGKNYKPGSALEYLNKSREQYLMHPKTKQELEFILTMLRDKGEKETFHYLRSYVLKGEPFPWERKEMAE